MSSKFKSVCIRLDLCSVINININPGNQQLSYKEVDNISGKSNFLDYLNLVN